MDQGLLSVFLLTDGGTDVSSFSIAVRSLGVNLHAAFKVRPQLRLFMMVNKLASGSLYSFFFSNGKNVNEFVFCALLTEMFIVWELMSG